MFVFEIDLKDVQKEDNAPVNWHLVEKMLTHKNHVLSNICGCVMLQSCHLFYID